MTISSPSPLLDYFSSSSVTFHPSLSVVQSPSQGYSIQSSGVIAVGEVVCSIPKEVVLSVRTTAIATLIEDECMAGVLGYDFYI